MDVKVGDCVKIRSSYPYNLGDQIGKVLHINKSESILVHFSHLEPLKNGLHTCQGFDPSGKGRWFGEIQVEVINSILSDLI